MKTGIMSNQRPKRGLRGLRVLRGIVIAIPARGYEVEAHRKAQGGHMRDEIEVARLDGRLGSRGCR